MKNWKLVTLALIVSFSSLSYASPPKKTAADSAKSIVEVFHEKEFGIETAYTLRTEDFDKYKESVVIGANYFITKGAGAHVGVALKDLDDQAIDLVEFGFAGRVPFDKLRLALTFGVGAECNFVNDQPAKTTFSKPKEKAVKTDAIEDAWAVYAEAGALFRANDFFDFFAKIRGERPIAGAEREDIGIYVGVNVPFRIK